MKITYIFLYSLILYFPRFSDTICLVDDIDLINRLKPLTKLDVIETLFGSISGGLYYRPLLSLTYKFDAVYLNLIYPLMYLENVIYFTISAWFASKIFEYIFKNNRELSVISTLFFIFTPLSVESVAWISGRTDLLALMFLMIGFYLLLRFVEEKKWYTMLFSLFMMLLSTLAKETTVVFFLAVPIVLTSKEILSSFKNRWGVVLGSILPSLIFSGAFFVLRGVSFKTGNNRISMTIDAIINSPEFAVMKFFRIFGFYFKKIVFPWPLNFMIVDVDPLYDILGLLVILISVFLLFKSRLVDRFFIAGLCFLLPVYPISFGQIAWTPYADRYAFIPFVFSIPFTVYYLNSILKKLNLNRVHISYVFALLVCVFAVSTFLRIKVWSDNTLLFEDTLKKNKDTQEAWFLAGNAWYNENDLKKAEKYYLKAKTSYSFEYNYKLDYNLGVLYLHLEQYEKSIKYFETVLSAKKGGESMAAGGVVEAYLKMLKRNKSDFEHLSKVLDEFIKNSGSIVKDGDNFYMLGKIYLKHNDKQRAVKYFQMAYERFSDSDPYKKIAQKFISKLLL